MSWGIEVTGTKEAVKTKLATQCERMAKVYEGKPEADDIRAFEQRATALIDALELGKDQYGAVEWNAVTVKGGGSHSTTPNGLATASMSMNVTRTSLAL